MNMEQLTQLLHEVYDDLEHGAMTAASKRVQKYADEQNAALRAELERLLEALRNGTATGEPCAELLVQRQRAEAAEADRERMDWLDGQGEPETYEDAPHALVWSVIGDPGQRSIRAAIDAARAALAGKERAP